MFKQEGSALIPIVGSIAIIGLVLVLVFAPDVEVEPSRSSADEIPLDTPSMPSDDQTIPTTVPISPTNTRTPAPAAPTPTPPPASTPVPTQNCHPSYTGACLTPGIGDYDCAGGEGDGPNYVAGPINVVGHDEFGLDKDGDGVACEN